jgi:hypothetical protein
MFLAVFPKFDASAAPGRDPTNKYQSLSRQQRQLGTGRIRRNDPDCGQHLRARLPRQLTINLTYGWGTFDNQAAPALTDPGSGAFSEGGVSAGKYASIDYATLKDWLSADGVDGSLGFNTNDPGPPAQWEEAALQEIGHALGWSTGDNQVVGYHPTVAQLNSGWHVAGIASGVP